MGFSEFIKGQKSIIQRGVLAGAVDRHSHLLFGVDDGVSTSQESLAVIEFMESLGVTDVWCTPHIMEDMPNQTEALKDRFRELQGMYAGSVKLHLAAEYMLDNLFEERLEAGDLLLMDDDVLLVETSTMAAPYDLKGILARILSSGYRPLLAHPERCRFLSEKEYTVIRSMGVMFQLNLGSLAGDYGNTVKKKAEWLLSHGMYDALGSDCHRLESIRQQYEKKAITSKVAALLKQKDAKGKLVAG